MKKRIVVMGADSPLGRSVMKALESSANIESVRGLAGQSSESDRRNTDLDFIPCMSDHRPLAEYLVRERIDTVVQCGLVPDRSGLGPRSCEAEVVATMCIGAAIAQVDARVGSWVLASSSAIYPISSHGGMLQRESQTLPRSAGAIAETIADAEEYARDVAERLPHLNVAILRLQQIVGLDAGNPVRGPLAALMARDPVPMPMGFDPVIQLLHLEDAASAHAFAVRAELAGIYNVASSGVIRWRNAVRGTGHRRFPVLPVRVGPLESVFMNLGFPMVPGELLDLVRFGHAVDTDKLVRAGWTPRRTQQDCVELLRRD